MKNIDTNTTATSEGIILTAKLNFDGFDCQYQVWRKFPYQSDNLIVNLEEISLLNDSEIEKWFRTLNLISDERNSEIIINRNLKTNQLIISFNFENIQ